MSTSIRLTATFRTDMATDKLDELAAAVAMALKEGGVPQARVRTETRTDVWVAAVAEHAAFVEDLEDEDLFDVEASAE